MTDFLTADDIKPGAAYVIASSTTRMADDIGRVLQNGIDRQAGTTCKYSERGATVTWTVTVAATDERAVASIRRAMSRWGAQAWAAGKRRPEGAGVSKPAPAAVGVTEENKHEAPTDRQISYAASLARQAGYRDITDARKALRGKHPVGGMKRQECSDLISFLRGKISA